jgi:polygalacturonase
MFFKPFTHPEIPAFPKREVCITEFGAVPDGKTACTDAIRAAIDSVHSAGGGRVVFPEGDFFTGPIHFKSGVE